MMHFNLPDLGEGLPDAILREWHIKENEVIDEDHIIATVETAKSLIDLPMPIQGRIIKRHGAEGDCIKTGMPLISYEPSPSNNTIHASTRDTKPLLNTATIKAVPAARALAKRLGINLNAIYTEKGEIITVEDVQRAQSNQKTKHFSLTSNQEAMSTAMANAYHQVVPATLTEDADIHSWTQEQNTLYTILKSLEQACTQHKIFQMHYHPKTHAVILHESLTVGIAVHSEHGLFMPVIRNVSSITQHEFLHLLNQFKIKAKNNTFNRDELHGASIVLSNIGSIAGRYATPLVIPPSLATLAIGKIRKEVVIYNDEIAIHPIMPLSLSFDHRIITGGQAALFLQSFIHALTDVNQPA